MGGLRKNLCEVFEKTFGQPFSKERSIHLNSGEYNVFKQEKNMDGIGYFFGFFARNVM